VVRGHWIPSDWDARRLLRFFAGLAMLALALTGPIASPAPSVPSPTVITTVAAETSVTVSDSASAPSSVRVPAAAPSAEGPVVLVVAALTVVLVGALLPASGSRAPPTR
jgi:hypothetical protein